MRALLRLAFLSLILCSSTPTQADDSPFVGTWAGAIENDPASLVVFTFNKDDFTWVQLITDHARSKQPEIQLPLSIVVQGHITTQESVVKLSWVVAGQKMEREMSWKLENGILVLRDDDKIYMLLKAREGG